MDAAASLGDRNALHAMHAAFELELGISTLAHNLDDRLFDAAKIAVAQAQNFGAPAHQLRVA